MNSTHARVEAARQVSLEARMVLTSLRGGPPHVARGDLAQDLMDLREAIPRYLEGPDFPKVEDSLKTSSPDELLHPGPIARPFLQVVVDPRAAGPHTLLALRSISRLLVHAKTLHLSLDRILKHVLLCKFEQTDPAADEAVEMAIADVLLLLVQLDTEQTLSPECLLEAFNTVFLTRNTFVHSQALCYHFEDVLKKVVEVVFSNSKVLPAVRLLRFLVNQLLHTPLVGGDLLDESTREASEAHDANRILCLRLVRTALQTVWSPADDSNKTELQQTLLPIIQDDLCLSLLMTGQAIWATTVTSYYTSPGFVSLPVLSEICATFSLLWHLLRANLVVQFETIWTGFYTRALVLLRKRPAAQDSLQFNANLVFDAEVEIILESLVDILTLHNHQNSIQQGDGGALETIFCLYDCHMRRSDVAMGLLVELTRSCGGRVDPEGQAALTPSNSAIFSSPQTIPPETPQEQTGIKTPPPSSVNSNQAVAGTPPMSESGNNDEFRHVPAHLKELCAQAIMGAMKCIFRDDQASAETMLERAKRKRSILLKQVPMALGDDDREDEQQQDATKSHHWLRDLKSQKRLMRKAAKIFNSKASRGIAFLVDSGLIAADPVTPLAVAKFLRNGIVVGLDKKAVGAYLGEAGKSPVAGKSPPSWERDWFHKEVLQQYCSLFKFEGQSLLDGLRMFLAAFRLPGEAQQIDRILQAFSDSCGRVCEESQGEGGGLFSSDPKKASDAAYLLSFSIIMLNTDQHNDNIREDRKMSVNDFIKNNTDYGRDITEKGKEFPADYLRGIYKSIREEEIRTEGEGADGAMTVERWKDVLRGSTEEDEDEEYSTKDVEDLTELVLEHAWKPIVSAVGALWGVSSRYVDRDALSAIAQQEAAANNGMLGVQGARLGMDMALETMRGVRQMGRIDIFRKIFACVCDYTGLIGEYTEDAIGRMEALSNSIEAQSAILVAFKMAAEFSEELDEESWKQIWSILLELRDLKLIARGKNAIIFHESEADLLTDFSRREWNMCLVKGDMEFDVKSAREPHHGSGMGSVFGAFGRALFGADESANEIGGQDSGMMDFAEPTLHGKEELVIWDECALSDDEGDDGEEATEDEGDLENPLLQSEGARFEHHLICESVNMSRQLDMPVTGLERVEETRKYQISPRARVRDRLQKSCSFESLVIDSRFMDDNGIRTLLRALVAMGADPSIPPPHPFETPRGEKERYLERGVSDVSTASSSFAAIMWQTPVSPASEAFAEVLICEIALKNKDRLKDLWKDVLQDHFLGRLTSILVNPGEGTAKIPVDPGLEKRVTGLLRLSIYAMQKADLANEIVSSWKYLLPMNAEQHSSSPLRALDRHIGEGLWRMVARVDDVLHLKEDGWEGLISLMNWCAHRGSCLKPIRGATTFPEDDVALQCYRTLHLLLSTKELEDRVPCSVVESLRVVVSAGERRNYSQLSIATLDLIGILHEKKISSIDAMSSADAANFWSSCWRKIVESLAEASEQSSDASVRQHALSMLTDLFLDKQGAVVPSHHLCGVLSEVCVPLAGRCITRLQMGNGMVSSSDELLIEFELCIGLIFKPLRHHLKNVLSTGASLSSIWKSVLSVLEQLLSQRVETDEPGGEKSHPIPEGLKKTMDNLANEHFQNAVKVLLSAGVLLADAKTPGDISSMTWEAAGRMGISDNSLEQWKQEAAVPSE